MLDAEDRTLLERVFGPQLPEGLHEYLYGSIAKGVDVEGDTVPRAAVQVLVNCVVADGLGGGLPIGFSVRQADGHTSLNVHVVGLK